MTDAVYPRLLDFLQRLEQAKIHYRLGHYRPEAVMAEISVPGERWEVEFLDDGTVAVERFVSPGRIDDESALTELFARHSADSDVEVPAHDAVSR